MILNPEKIGEQIAKLRKNKNLSQNELGERLNISFQAVSKWERGESLPDVQVLVDLARVLETSTDNILLGGERLTAYNGKITVAEMKKGISALKEMGESLGKDNLIYQSAIWGVNEKMNTDVEEAFKDENIFECFVAEAIMQNLLTGAYIDVTDVKNNFKNEKYKKLVLDFAKKFNIV